MPLDPATAIANAIAQFFAFAATEQGQGIVADARKLNGAIADDVMKLIAHLGSLTGK